MTTAAFWSQRRESNVIKTIMGGCFSFLHKPDLQTSTFSHYRSANIFLTMSHPVFSPQVATFPWFHRHCLSWYIRQPWGLGNLCEWLIDWSTSALTVSRLTSTSTQGSGEKKHTFLLVFWWIFFQQVFMHKAINETDPPRFLIRTGTRGRATQKLC